MKLKDIASFSCLVAGAAADAHVSSQMPAATKLNFLFIMTDDQDLKLNSLSYTPLTMKHMAQKGTVFANHFATTALCCPSRVSLLTGRLAHNTNVTDINPPWGGYPKFVERGFNDNYLPVWMQQAGYGTYYTGKLMNSHSLENYDSPHAAGFNGSDFVLDPYTYDYMNATYQRNHDKPISYLGRHTTEVLREKAMGFLGNALAGERPFMAVAPIAPHSNMNGTYGGGAGPLWMDEPIPEERHRHLFPDAKVPRTANFNPKHPTGVSWIHDLPYRNQSVVDYNDHYYRQRLRALQGVDELVDGLVTRLEKSGKINNAFIIYPSDNGFHISQHRLPPGETCGFEEDVRVPFMMRGPGIPENHVEKAVTTHIDIAPTLFQLAGLRQRLDFDGTPMPTTTRASDDAHEHVTIEHWGQGMLEGDLSNLGTPTVPNNTYKAVRLLSADYNLFYSVWCNNEHELYDLTTDLYQVNNLWKKEGANQQDVILGRPMSEVVPRLDALLMVLKSCVGTECVKPWDTLHPDGSVRGLKDALHQRYDRFYRSQPKVSFDRCAYGYEINAEGPQSAFAFRNGYSLEAWV